MLIFVVTPLFPNEKNRQQGIYVYEQCKALENQGNKVVVLNISPLRWNKWGSKSCRTIQVHKEGNIHVYTLHPRGILSSKLPHYAILNAWPRLIKLYQEAVNTHGRPDVFHAHFTFTAGYLTSRLSKRTNIPFVVTEHYSLFLKSTLNKYIKKKLIETVESASAFICVSNNLKSAIKHWTGTKREILVVPNLIDLRFKYYEPLSEADNFCFFSAGNLTPSKSFDLLISSFCDAFSEKDNVILNIAGDGREYSKLMDLIISNGRESQIKLLGRLDREEILGQYIKSDCFVLPSKYETFGIVYREAMAVGRPIISTENGGIEEGWESGFGKLVPIDDQSALINALLDMYRSNSYDFKYISKSCLEKYSFEEVGKKINDVLIHSKTVNKK